MEAGFQPLGVILPANDWTTILPSRTTSVPEIAQNDLGEMSLASPARWHLLFIRTEKALYRIGGSR